MSSRQFRNVCATLRTVIKAMPESDRALLEGTLPHLIAAGSSYSYRIGASDFLRLCAQVGIDPVSGLRIEPQTEPGTLCLASVGAGCAVKRSLRRLTMRAAALEIGVSAATLSRLEMNLPISIESLIAVCVFIGVHPLHYMRKLKVAA